MGQKGIEKTLKKHHMVTHHVMISETVVSLTSEGSGRARVFSKNKSKSWIGEGQVPRNREQFNSHCK